MGYKDKEKQKEYNRKWVAERRRLWFEGKTCAKCGSVDKLEIDHIDESTKDPSLKKHHTGSIWSWSEERRNTELAKCQILCERCHLEKTSDNRPRKHGATMYQTYKCRCEVCVAWKRQSNAERYK